MGHTQLSPLDQESSPANRRYKALYCILYGLEQVKNYQKLVKDASNLTFFIVYTFKESFVWNILIGVGQDIKKIIKFYKNELRL